MQYSTLLSLALFAAAAVGLPSPHNGIDHSSYSPIMASPYPNAPPAAADLNPQYNAPAAAQAMGALYFQTNTPSGPSSVISLPYYAHGKLGSPISTLTGGSGMLGLTIPMNSTTQLPVSAGRDSLFSQSAVHVSAPHNLLFAVNAGSATLSAFHIDAADPTKLTLLGKPMDTMGGFPVSVAYSAKIQTACVLNGGVGAGVACFKVHPRRGLVALDSAVRPVEIGQPVGAGEVPTGPAHTASQILFSPDGTKLAVTVKGNAMMNESGYIAVWPVKPDGCVAHERAATIVAPMPFGSVFADDSRMFVTDPSFGVGIVDATAGAVVAGKEMGSLMGQMATCWAARDGRGGVVVTDAGRGVMVRVDEKSGKMVGSAMVEGMEGMAGLFDVAVVGGKWAYALRAGMEGVQVVLVEIGKQGQMKEIRPATEVQMEGVGLSAMGMAVYEKPVGMKVY